MAHLQKIKKKVFFLALTPVFCVFGAQAASVTNLSGRAVVLEVEDRSQPSGHRIEQLKNGQTYNPSYGDVNVRYEGREHRLEYALDYAIWKEGGIQPQKTNRHKLPY